MALSLKEFASSVSGKLLTGALALGAGSTMAQSAEAVEITTITKDAAKLCIGSDSAGAVHGEKVGWKGTLADGQSTGLTTTDKLVILEQEYNSSNAQMGTHRNFAYTQFPSNNDIIEGYYLYDVADVNNIAKSLVINGTNYPDYKDSTRIHFIKGATPDQDQMIFLNDTIKVYKSPFDQAGKVKSACKTGPETPEFTYKINFPWTDKRAIGNFIFLAMSGSDPVIHKLTIGQNAITEDPNILTLTGDSASSWAPIHSGFVTMKDPNGKETTCLVIRGNKIVLADVNDISKTTTTNATGDVAVEDPAGRFKFETTDDGAGNYDIYVSDSWANPSTSKKIITGDTDPIIQGNLAYADGYPTPAWVLYKDGKAYLIELINTATMNFKITETPFDTFTKNYAGGDKACITIPGQVATVVKTGTPSDAGDASVVEKDQDAGTTDTDAGSNDAGDAAAEVVEAPDAGVDTDAGSTDAAADTAPDTAPDQSVQEVDGFTDKDAPEDTAKVDVKINPPDVNQGDNGNTGTDDATADAGEKPDASGADTAKPGVDGGSSDTSQIKNTPPPKDNGCNAGSSGNSSPLAIAAATALALGLARRKKNDVVEEAE